MNVHRRDFLSAGSLVGLSAMGLPNLVANTKEGDTHQKAVILVFLQGGISHQESFIAKPDSIEKARSVNGYVKTKSGFMLGSEFDELAKVSDLFSVAHSFGHINPSHGAGSEYVMTGYNAQEESDANQKHPSFGSIVNKQYGSNNVIGIPHYVALNRLHADRASYLGSAYNPFNITEDGKRNLLLDLPRERFTARMNLMKGLDNRFEKDRVTKDIDGYKNQGQEMLLGKVRDVFEAKNEPESVRKAYGPGGFAESCMMARRLVQNGVKFVTIGHGGWDMHSNIQQGYAQRAPELDHGVAQLLKDLESHGLLDTTMVVLTAEFGRTLLNRDAGRDHWPALTSLLIAGGDYKGGKVIGEASADGMTPLANAYKPVDLLHTIVKHMNIDPKTRYTDTSGRPRYVVEGESKLIV